MIPLSVFLVLPVAMPLPLYSEYHLYYNVSSDAFVNQIWFRTCAHRSHTLTGYRGASVCVFSRREW